jgi:hypothetical protein
VSIKLGSLFEGHPDRSREVLNHGAGPQRQYIDATVRLPVVAERARECSAFQGLTHGLTPRSRWLTIWFVIRV